ARADAAGRAGWIGGADEVVARRVVRASHARIVGQGRSSVTAFACCAIRAELQSPVQYTDTSEIRPSRTSARISSRAYQLSLCSSQISSTSMTKPVAVTSTLDRRTDPRLGWPARRIATASLAVPACWRQSGEE